MDPKEEIAYIVMIKPVAKQVRTIAARYATFLTKKPAKEKRPKTVVLTSINMRGLQCTAVGLGKTMFLWYGKLRPAVGFPSTAPFGMASPSEKCKGQHLRSRACR